MCVGRTEELKCSRAVFDKSAMDQLMRENMEKSGKLRDALDLVDRLGEKLKEAESSLKKSGEDKAALEAIIVELGIEKKQAEEDKEHDGPSSQCASGNKKSPNEGHDANNINVYTKILSKRLVADMQNYQNGSSSADPTQLMNQNLETHIINESGTNSQLENPEDEEERKARKGKAVVISSRKPMMKRKDFPSTKKQCGVVLGNGEEAQKVITRMKNSDAANQNGSSSATLNPTKLNQNLETGINASTGIVRPEIPKEYEEVENKVESLRDENKELRKELVWLSQKCVDITNENDSLLEAMVDKYGEETIAQLSKQYLDLAHSNI
ncbi:hypothetical protein S245_042617 [Arachis hypogaea]